MVIVNSYKLKNQVYITNFINSDSSVIVAFGMKCKFGILEDMYLTWFLPKCSLLRRSWEPILCKVRWEYCNKTYPTTLFWPVMDFLIIWYHFYNYFHSNNVILLKVTSGSINTLYREILRWYSAESIQPLAKIINCTLHATHLRCTQHMCNNSTKCFYGLRTVVVV